jgi:hypothetical protein
LDSRAAANAHFPIVEHRYTAVITTAPPAILSFATSAASGRWVAVLSAVLAALYLIVALAGVPQTGNDTWVFVGWGEALRATGWDLVAFREEVEFLAGTEIFYVASATVFALMAAAFGDNWLTGYVIFNWVTMSATALVMLLSLRRLGFDGTSLLVAALFMGVLWEHVYWVSVAYTDISFNLLLALVFASCAVGLTEPPGRRRHVAWGLALVLALVTVTYRPTGLWVVGMLVVAFAAGTHRFPFVSGNVRRPVLRAVAVAGLALISGWIGASVVLANADLLPASFLRDLILHVGVRFQDGMIVSARPETYSAPPEGAIDYATMIALKFFYYFKFSAVGFGGAHNLYNWITFAPFYLLVLVGVGSVVFAPSEMNQSILGAGILALIWVAVFALAHAVTIIDFDWRYRLPVYAPLGVLAIIGFSRVQSALVRLVVRPAAT